MLTRRRPVGAAGRHDTEVDTTSGALHLSGLVSSLSGADGLDLRDGEALGLLNALPVAIYTTDAAGRITYYNEAAVELWGVRPEIGKSEFCGSWKLFLPDGTPLPHDQCPMAVALRERRPIRGAEAMAERPDGTRIPFMPFPTPLYDAPGPVVGGVNVLVDISEHKRADAALARRAQEQATLYRFTDALYRARGFGDVYEAALNAITDTFGSDRASILLFDPEGVMRFVAWRGLSDDYRRAVVGHSPWKPGDRDAVPLYVEDVAKAPDLAGLLDVLGAEKVGALAFIPLTADGAVTGKFMAYFDAPRSFDAHESELAVAIARQLGFALARLRAEAARRQSEHELRLLAAVVDSSDDAIVAVDLDGLVTSWNQGAERLYGYSAEAVLGRPIGVVIPPDRHDEEIAILARISHGERVDHYETVRQHQDGTLFDISLTVSPIKDQNGAIVGASKVARDITDQRRAQQQQQLLLREMDHRIKNLFTLASSVVSLSARSADSAEALSTAVRDRLGALARAHALTLQRPTADSHPQATSLHALIATILSPYEGTGGRVAITGDDYAVSGSAVTSLALVFNEFATNAAKYGSLSTPDGRVDVACSTEGELARIVWTETGGPAAHQPQGSHGFGSVLADMTATRQLGGTLRRDWRAAGLVLELTAARDRFGG